MIMNNILITWLYADSKDDEGMYSQVGNHSGDWEFQKVYWKCVFDFYKTAILTNGHKLRYVFFTNLVELPQDIDGLDIADFFIKNRIEVVTVQLTKKTPVEWASGWRNQFYLYDILEYLRDNGDINDNYVILDSDCLIRADLMTIFNDIASNGLIAFDCGYRNPDEEINGITSKQMKEIYEKIYDKEVESKYLNYYGGELFAMTHSMVDRICVEFSFLWDKNYELFTKGMPKLTEEAHFFSVLIYNLKYCNNIGNKYIDRIWTSFHYDTVKGDENRLSIWHLPVEKKYGLDSLFNYLITHPECTKDEYLNKANKIMRLSSPRVIRRARMLGYKLNEKISTISIVASVKGIK